MVTTMAQMTKDELMEMIETVVEQKLLEVLDDPDEGLTIRESVRNRLLRQKQVREVLAHYETQTEEEAVAEDEAAAEDSSQTIMEVPNDLVPKVHELIAKQIS